MLYVLLMLGLASSQLLNGVPVMFSIDGNVNYISDSGASLIGYNLTIGFNRHSWIGVRFDTGSNSNNDVLIIRRSSTFVTYGSGSGFTLSASDHYVLQGNSNRLMNDSLSLGDLTCTNLTNSNTFVLKLTRSTQNSQGEDWDSTVNRWTMLKICFFTSDEDFNFDRWSGVYQSCYGYEVSDLLSTWRGSYLSAFSINNQQMQLWGGINGPLPELRLFFYQQAPINTYANPLAFAVELGYVKQNVGNDYIIRSTVSTESGDYFGFGLDSMAKDINYHGYEDATTSVNYVNCGSGNSQSGLGDQIRLAISRLVWTEDGYDVVIYRKQPICLTMFPSGTLSSSITPTVCTTVQLPLLYPVQTVASAIQVFEFKLHYAFWLILVIVIS